MKDNIFKKYKWLYLFIAAAALLTFGIIMLFNNDFATKIVYYFTALGLIIFVIIRFVPFVKTERQKYAIVLNVSEMILDLIIGVVLFVLTIRGQNNFENIYPFLIGSVFMMRGLIYLVEVTFLHTKPQPLLFVIHVALIILASIIMALFKNLRATNIATILAVIFLIIAGIAIIDAIHNYSNFRNGNYKKDKKNKKEEVVATDSNVILDKDSDINSDQTYVN